jgi:ankyrin repeat protein
MASKFRERSTAIDGHPLLTEYTIFYLLWRVLHHWYRDLRLHEAIEKGNFEQCRELLKENSAFISRNNNGKTVFHLALESGAEDIVALLLSKPQDFTILRHAPPNLIWDLINLITGLLEASLRIAISTTLLSLPFAYFWPHICWYLFRQTLWIFITVMGLTVVSERIYSSWFLETTTENLLVSTTLEYDGALGTALSRLIKCGFLPNEEEAEILWMKAVSQGYVELATHLIVLGIDVNAGFPYLPPGETEFAITTPILQACESGHVKLVELLLSSGANASVLDSTGSSALFLACSSKAKPGDGNPERLLVMLLATKAIKHLDHVKPRKLDWTLTLNSPLASAAYDARVDAVRLLLEAGANPNQTDESGVTALHAVNMIGKEDHEGNTSIIEMLIDHGANVNAMTTSGWTPLGIAANWGMSPIACVLLTQAGAKVSQSGAARLGGPLHAAARHDVCSNQVLRAILAAEDDIDVEAANLSGLSPLLLVLERPVWSPESNATVKDAIQILIDYGANVNSQAGALTPLEQATSNEKVEAVKFLIDHGAKVDQCSRFVPFNDPKGEFVRPTMKVSLLSRLSVTKPELFEILLAYGATPDCDSMNRLGKSVLESACTQNGAWIDTVKHLIHAGVDVDGTGPDGATALHTAAQSMNPGLVSVLCEAGANRLATWKHGTPLHSFCLGMKEKHQIFSSDKEPMLEALGVLLIQDGHEAILMKDSNGATPLHILVTAGQTGGDDDVYVVHDGHISLQIRDPNIPNAETMTRVIEPMIMMMEKAQTPDIDLFMATDSCGRTVFHMAAEKGDVDLMKFMLRRVEPDGLYEDIEPGTDPKRDLCSSRDSKGWLALHHAVSSGHVEAIDFLYGLSRLYDLLTKDDMEMLETMSKRHMHFESSNLAEKWSFYAKSSEIDLVKTPQLIQLNWFTISYCVAVAILASIYLMQTKNNL